MNRILRANLLLVAALCASGCQNMLSWDEPPQRQSANQSAVRIAAPEPPVGPQEYRVRPGDTMYSIAFRNSLDFRELARWNGIGSDYLIRPGQVLRLAQPPRPALIEGDIVSHPDDTTPAPSTRPMALPAEGLGVPPPPLPPVASRGRGGVAPSPGPRPKPIALPTESMGTPPPPLGMGGSMPAPPPPSPYGSTPGGASVAIAPPPAPVLPPPPITSESGGPYRWQWPTQGVVVRGYNPGAGSKGLDFSGSLGQSVVAAAPGKVVYSGSALKGYGELIIIKHDDLRLSAYGYNRTRLVNEGDMVRGGQPIAELGLGPENRPILHFEIRERGQPVDPVPYLPARTASN
ncbi:MAG: LysM peptidoglycan-binding protein [Panacagrimonas sp.]|nr:peptidoglycan DD-metalloendopeptidase family protein [Panacagrimonas sp.]MCC2656996.1 LysM peptidoglycan-binding protein [Panacagrimonas sp.]